MKASHAWAHDVIAAGRAAGVVPPYASADWLALDPDDPRRLAAIVIAAECWWYDGLPEVMAERLRDELLFLDQLVVERIRRTSWDVAAAKDWVAVAERPTYDELEARRRRGWSA